MLTSSGLPEDSELKASELEEILTDLEKELESVGSVMRFNVVWGRRPQE
jgi:gliotoxin biosynthesis N-methyltransferase